MAEAIQSSFFMKLQYVSNEKNRYSTDNIIRDQFM